MIWMMENRDSALVGVDPHGRHETVRHIVMLRQRTDENAACRIMRKGYITFPGIDRWSNSSIICGRCGMRSYNRSDVAHKYCGNCNDYCDWIFTNVLSQP